PYVLPSIDSISLLTCQAEDRSHEVTAPQIAKPLNVLPAARQGTQIELPVLQFIEYTKSARDLKQRGSAEKLHCEGQICSALYRPFGLRVQVRSPQADARALVAETTFMVEVGCSDFGPHRVVSSAVSVEQLIHCELTGGSAAGMHLLLHVSLDGRRTRAELFMPEYLNYDPEFAACIKLGTIPCRF